MNLSKRLMCAVVAVCLCAQISMTVYADNEDVSGNIQSDGGALQSTYISEDGETLVIDDPSYWKYGEIQNTDRSVLAPESTSRAISGASSLTHNSKFDGVEKEYGIDVSYYQYNIDWNKVKKAGVKFVIIRIGYRGYGSAGTLVTDTKFHENIKGAQNAGLDVGAYFYSQATTSAEAKQEAQYCINELKGYKLDLPVYYDLEYAYDGTTGLPTGRFYDAKLTKAQKTALCTSFCDTMIAAGYYSGVYTYYSMLLNDLDSVALAKKYPVWLAHYTDETDYPNTYDMWQYSGSGKVDGIMDYNGNKTSVDMNVRYNVNYAPAQTIKLTKSGTKLSWNSVSDATGYTIYSRSAGGKETALKSQTGTSYTLPSVSAGTSYYVKAYRTYGGKKFYGSASNTATESAKHISTTSIIVSNAEYTGRAVLPSVTVKDGNTTLKEGVDYTLSYSNNTNLGTGAVKVTGKGDYTSSITKIFTIYLAKVKLGSASAVTDGINVSWNSVKGAANYNVYRKTEDSGWERIAVVSDTSYKDTNVLSNVKYTYTVRAVNGSYISPEYDNAGVSATYKNSSAATGSIKGNIKLPSGVTEATVSVAPQNSAAVYGSTVKAGEFTVPNLAAGTYTVTVKAGKCAAYTATVTVGETSGSVNAELRLLGDVNGDGKITTADVGKVNAHVRGTKKLTGYDVSCANANGDGNISTADVGLINAHVRGTKKLW